MTPSQQRPESPPYTTSDANQSIEAYQRNFWARQMAKVEDQVSLDDSSVSNTSISAHAGSSSASRINGIGPATGAVAGSSKDLMDLFKPQAGQLPLARIKKVMKASDDQVKVCICTN